MDKGAEFATRLVAIKGHNPEYIQPSRAPCVQTHYVTQFLVTSKLREHVSLFLLHKIVSLITLFSFSHFSSNYLRPCWSTERASPMQQAQMKRKRKI